MLEAGLWLQGCIAWQLVLIDTMLPIVKFMKIMMNSLPQTNEAESIGSAFSTSDDQPTLYGSIFQSSHSRRINDTEVRIMPYGTVKWFNKKTGAGFIRTDDGENVLFVSSLESSDPRAIYNGARVSLDVLKSHYGGLMGINIRAANIPE
jgi:cold shock CspA family protein